MNLPPQVEAFQKAVAAYKQAAADLSEKRLDRDIARRSGDNVEAAEKAYTDFSTDVWYPAYSATKIAAQAMCNALGINPADLKEAL